MEVEANNCVGPLSCRSPELQVTLSSNSCSTYKFKINKLCPAVLWTMLFWPWPCPTSLNRFQRPTNEFASEIATGNLISMFKLN